MQPDPQMHGGLGTATSNQQGFREIRSTMSAQTEMQKEQFQSTEDGLKTRVLVWDLSAAFRFTFKIVYWKFK